MPDEHQDTLNSRTDSPRQQAGVEGEKDGGAESKLSYILFMVYAMLFGTGAALLTAGYIVFYSRGVQFFAQPSHFGLNIGRFWPLILLTAGGLVLGLAIKYLGQHSGLGVVQKEYSETGRVDYRYLPTILLQAFITLFSGAAVGPEGPLVFLTGGVGTWCVDKLKLHKEEASLLVYCAVAGAFGGFLGSPIIGAIGALEYMFIHELNYYRHAIPGLLAASFGYVVYWLLLHTSYMGIYSFPNYASPQVADLGWALAIGVAGGLLGTIYKVIFGVINLVFKSIERFPVIRAVIGGVIVGLIGSFLPLTLYSGQNQLQQIIHSPAAYSAGMLLLLMVARILTTSTSFATGFEGGPIFPLLFVGGTFGLMISQIFPFIPEGVAVTSGMAAFASAIFPMPLTTALLLGFMGGQPDLTPTITIGAVIGFLTGKALAPLLPKPREQQAGSRKSTGVVEAGTN